MNSRARVPLVAPAVRNRTVTAHGHSTKTATDPQYPPLSESSGRRLDSCRVFKCSAEIRVLGARRDRVPGVGLTHLEDYRSATGGTTAGHAVCLVIVAVAVNAPPELVMPEPIPDTPEKHRPAPSHSTGCS